MLPFRTADPDIDYASSNSSFTVILAHLSDVFLIEALDIRVCFESSLNDTCLIVRIIETDPILDFSDLIAF